MPGLRTELGQFTILSAHFFGRLFRNETVDFEDQMKEKLYVALTLLAVFFAWASWLMLFKYHFVADLNRSWQEKNYIFTLMMLVFALITLLEWDILFPDRQDFLNLTPLPVRLRTVFAAKLASFVMFVGLFSVAMMSVSAVLFSIYLAEWRANSLVLAGRYVVSHVLAGFAAALVVFFTFVFLQFLLMALLPHGLYKRVSLGVRFLLIAALVFLLLSFIAAPSVLGRSFHDLGDLKESGDMFMFRFPPLWFVGLYEVLLGTRDAVFIAEARTAGLSLLAALLAFAAASGLSYHRHLRKTLEVQKSGPAFFRVREGWRKALAATVLRTPEERTVYGFFADTLRASSKHRTAFSYYLAVGAAAILLLAVAYRQAFRMLTPDNGFLLAQPLLLAFTIIAGIRVLVDQPAASEANWVFRMTETGTTRRYLDGLKKAVFIKLILPLFLAVFVLHAFLWDPGLAFVHAAFGTVVSGLAVAAAFYHYRKVPFACTYVPGKIKLHFTAIPALIGLLLTMMALTAIEKAVLDDPVRDGAAVLAGAAVLGLALRLGNRRFYRDNGLVYEEEPESAMVELPGEF
jgi:hypothetical protein